MKNNGLSKKIYKDVYPKVLKNLFALQNKKKISATDSEVVQCAVKQSKYLANKASRHVINKAIKMAQDTVLDVFDANDPELKKRDMIKAPLSYGAAGMLFNTASVAHAATKPLNEIKKIRVVNPARLAKYALAREVGAQVINKVKPDLPYEAKYGIASAASSPLLVPNTPVKGKLLAAAIMGGIGAITAHIHKQGLKKAKKKTTSDGIFDFVNKIKNYRQKLINEGRRNHAFSEYSRLKSNELMMKLNPDLNHDFKKEENEKYKKGIKIYTNTLNPKEKQKFYKDAKEIFNKYDKPGLVSELRREPENISRLKKLGLLKK